MKKIIHYRPETIERTLTGNREINADNIHALTSVRKLQALTLANVTLDAAIIQALASLTQLQSITLRTVTLNPAIIQALVAAAPQLQSLTLSNITLNPAIIQALAAAPQLQSLTLSNITLNPAIIQALAYAPQLQSLNLSYAKLDANAIQALAYAPQLQSLNLSYAKLDASAILALAPTLATLTQLRCIDLSLDNLDAASIETLAPTLASLPQLLSLVLRNVRLNAAAIYALASASQLQYLDLSFAELDAAAIRALMTTLGLLTELESYGLTGIELDENKFNEILTRRRTIKDLISTIQFQIVKFQRVYQQSVPLRDISMRDFVDKITENLNTLFHIGEDIGKQYGIEPKALNETYDALNCEFALACNDIGAAVLIAQSMTKFPMHTLLQHANIIDENGQAQSTPMIVSIMLRELCDKTNDPAAMSTLLELLLTLEQHTTDADQTYRLKLRVAQLADPNENDQHIQSLSRILYKPQNNKNEHYNPDRTVHYRQRIIDSYNDKPPDDLIDQNPEPMVIWQLTLLADHYEKRAFAQEIAPILDKAGHSPSFFQSSEAAKSLQTILNDLQVPDSNLLDFKQALLIWLENDDYIEKSPLASELMQAITHVIGKPNLNSEEPTLIEQRNALCQLLKKQDGSEHIFTRHLTDL